MVRAMYHADIYRVLIASPSDLAEERQIATEAVHEWNIQHSAAESIALLPVRWETHAMPQAGIRPQKAINQQVANQCDILIGMFWTKIGTKTGMAESGTVEEIDEFVASGKPALLYFSTRPVDPNLIDLRQQRRLRKFQEQTYRQSLVGTFNQLHDLRQTLVRDLMHLVRDLRASQRPAAATSETVELRLATLQNQVKELALKFDMVRLDSPAPFEAQQTSKQHANIDAERAILGSIFLNNGFLSTQEVSSLEEEDFSMQSHALIFRRMMELATAGMDVDFVTLTEKLGQNKEIESVGGVAYVTSLTDELPRVKDIQPYVRIVKALSAERRKRP
jgi:hypothetical protein